MTAEVLSFETIPRTAPLLVRAVLGGRKRRSEWPEIEAHLAPTCLPAETVAQYRTVCGFGPGGPLPPTLPQVLAVPVHVAMLTHSRFPVPAMGVVHVKQVIECLQPLPTAASLAIDTRLSPSRPAKRGIEFDLETTASLDGSVVWRGITSILSRSGGDSTKSSTPDAEPPASTREAVAATESATRQGELIRSATWSIAEDLGRRYTSVAGDFNPIHLYAWSAKLLGFKRAIIHGMWLLARSIAELDSDVPAAPYRIEVAFKRPVFMPSTVCFSARRIGDEVTFVVADRKDQKEHLIGSVRAI